MFCDCLGTCAHNGKTFDCVNCMAGSSVSTPSILPVSAVGADGRTIMNKSEFDRYVTDNPFDYLRNSERPLYYQGVKVVKHSTQLNSFQFGGTIYLHTRDFDEITLKHEYGHYVQEQELGTVAYLIGIFAPSALCSAYSNYKYISDEKYYSLPWEITAESFGDVHRSIQYVDGAQTRGNIYYKFLKRWS